MNAALGWSSEIASDVTLLALGLRFFITWNHPYFFGPNAVTNLTSLIVLAFFQIFFGFMAGGMMVLPEVRHDWIAFVYTGVGDGVYPVGVSLEYAAQEYVRNGAPAKLINPGDGTVVEANGAGIIKGAPHGAAARTLVDFLVRKDVSETALKKFYRRPARGDIDVTSPGVRLPALSILTLARYDFRKWAAQRSGVLARFKEVVLKTR